MKKILLFVFVALLLSSCSNKDNLCMEVPNPDCICIEIYDPVCGCNDVTYGNSCKASCAGIMEYTSGACP
jgi:hypothetical protein